MFNQDKALKVKEKQLKMQAKAKELEKKALEEQIRKNGCPIKNAEVAYFNHLKQMSKELEAKLKKINSCTSI